MNDQELQAQNAAHLRALELSQKENQELKTKVASLQGQMQQLLKLIQGFKSERFVTQTSNPHNWSSSPLWRLLLSFHCKKKSPIPETRRNTQAVMLFPRIFP